MGQGKDFVQAKFNAAQQVVQAAATAQEKLNYASQALEIMGKATPTQDDTDQLVVLMQKLV